MGRRVQKRNVELDIGGVLNIHFLQTSPALPLKVVVCTNSTPKITFSQKLYCSHPLCFKFGTQYYEVVYTYVHYSDSTKRSPAVRLYLSELTVPCCIIEATLFLFFLPVLHMYSCCSSSCAAWHEDHTVFHQSAVTERQEIGKGSDHQRQSTQCLLINVILRKNINNHRNSF